MKTKTKLQEALESITYYRQMAAGYGVRAKKLREALQEVGTQAHCISKAGPLSTPTLSDAWNKFDMLSVLCDRALSEDRVQRQATSDLPTPKVQEGNSHPTLPS